MDNRVWDSGASASPPTPPALPSNGYPSPGNPSAPTPATKGGAYWFHQMGEELRAILTAAGVTPDHTVLNQLLTALRSAGVFQTPALGDRTTKAATMACFSQEFGASLAVNGYQKLPSGLILQWGLVSTALANTSYPFTYPIAFPTACRSVLVTSAATGQTASGNVDSAATTTSVGVRNSVASSSVYVLAIGY